MSYKILYDPELNHKFPPGRKPLSTFGWGTSLLLAVILLFMISISGALETIKYWILPGDPIVTEAAFVNFVEDLDAGAPMEDAFTDFCVKILKNEISDRY